MTDSESAPQSYLKSPTFFQEKILKSKNVNQCYPTIYLDNCWIKKSSEMNSVLLAKIINTLQCCSVLDMFMVNSVYQPFYCTW